MSYARNGVRINQIKSNNENKDRVHYGFILHCTCYLQFWSKVLSVLTAVEGWQPFDSSRSAQIAREEQGVAPFERRA